MKQLKKKAPDIVIPLIVRVNVLAFLSFFLSFFLFFFFGCIQVMRRALLIREFEKICIENEVKLELKSH